MALPRVRDAAPPSGPVRARRAARRALRDARGGAVRVLRPLRRALASARASGPEPVRQLHLAWTGDPASSVEVLWQSPRRSRDWTVELRGPAPARRAPARSCPSPGPNGRLHTARFEGLAPDTEHVYRVVRPDGTPATAWQRFRTAPKRAGRFRAVFLCDVGLAGRPDGTTAAVEAVIAAVASEQPLCVLGGGDYAYADRDPRILDPAEGIDRWLEQLGPLLAGAPFVAQYGNHDVELGERLADWAPRIPHPKGSPAGRSYSLDVGPVHLVGLYAPGRAPAAGELRWLADDLAGERARRADWRVVFQHAPLFAHGRSHPARPEVRALAERFEHAAVDVHLSGHDQSYERTHPRCGGVDAAPLEAGSGRYAAGQGVVYAKVSPAGKLSERGRGFSALPPAPAPGIARQDDRHHHWAVLDVSPERLDVAIRGLAPEDGAVLTVDRFSLEREA